MTDTERALLLAVAEYITERWPPEHYNESPVGLWLDRLEARRVGVARALEELKREKPGGWPL